MSFRISDLAVNGVITTASTITAGGSIYAGGNLYINDTNTRLTEGNSDSLRIQTSTGYIDIGSMNSSYIHIQADRQVYLWANGGSYIFDTNVIPYSDNARSLGTSGSKWSSVNAYGATIGRVVLDYDGTDSWFRMQSGNRMRITTTGGTDFIIPNTGNMTYNGNTVWHAGNLTNLSQLTNGPGYITNELFGAVTTGGTTDWNHVTNTRPGTGYTLLLGSHTNGFGVGNYYHAFNLEYGSKTGGGNVTQLAISYGTPGNDIRMRGRYDGTWSSWVTFINSGNIGSYALTSLPAHNHDASNITSGTLSNARTTASSANGSDTIVLRNSSGYFDTEGIGINKYLYIGGYRTFSVGSLYANGTQALRWEIARIGIDYNDWNSVGTFEVELHESYFSTGLKKVYNIWYGYVSNSGIRLVEYRGAGSDHFRVVIGSEVVVSGDHRYLPVYVDVNYYSSCHVVIKTNRSITGNSNSAVGAAYIFNSPSSTNIASFSVNESVEFTTHGSASVPGSFGIGTTPTTKLDVRGNMLLKGDATDGGTLTITRRYSTGQQTINFNNNHPTTNLDWTGARIVSADAGNYNGYLDFQVSLGNNGSETAGTNAVATVVRLDKSRRTNTLGQLVIKAHSSSDADYSNPLWIWANPDTDAIVIQNTTASGTAPKIYFRDTNGTIQTSNTLIRLRTSNSDSLSAWLNGSTWNCSGDIVAYASDRRLKENITVIPDALAKLTSLSGVTFDWNSVSEQAGFIPKRKSNEVGVIAQEVQAVLPEVVKPAPISDQYLTVQYEKIVPLLIEAIKELAQQVADLRGDA
jgi:hypothetical protein